MIQSRFPGLTLILVPTAFEVTRDDDADEFGLGGRLHGGRLGRLGGRMRRAPPQNLQLELKEDGDFG